MQTPVYYCPFFVACSVEDSNLGHPLECGWAWKPGCSGKWKGVGVEVFLEGLEKSKAAAQWRAASKTVGDRARDAKVLSGIVVPKHGFSQKETCHYPPLRCVAA